MKVYLLRVWDERTEHRLDLAYDSWCRSAREAAEFVVSHRGTKHHVQVFVVGGEVSAGPDRELADEMVLEALR